MAKREESLTTDKSTDDAIRAGTETLTSLGLKVKETGPGTLEAKAGSKLLVYWIGLILPASSMPVKVHYTVTDKSGKRNIDMQTKSSVPLSFYLWKYKKRANEVADALKSGVAAKLGT